ncbi:MAG: DUF3343 domain-containing protein [Oscillospiraceae bacterium]|nr:DUF3343 domain-containing protein [Oscillospiraceae bacterium]
MPEEILLVFPSTRDAIAGERALLAANLPVKVMPIPESLSDQCGICLRLPPELLEAGQTVLSAAGIAIAGVYKLPTA